ncbi:MAG: hypothetical protein R2726_10350 [Acidimicrobiales bacterium]
MISTLAQVTYETESTGVAVGLLIVYLVISIAFLAFYIWTLLQILKPSDAAWQASGQNKGLWIGLWVFGLVCGFGLIIALIYLFAIRPKVQAAETGGYGV